MKRELLGEVTCPSGKLMVVDLGLLGLWSHSDPPLLADWDAPEQIVRQANAAVDFRVEGRDAGAATALFGRSAGWLYDRPADFASTFADAIAERGLAAALVAHPVRIPHRQRVDNALAGGRATGIVEFHGAWATCIADLPADARLEVYGSRMGKGEFDDRWRHIELEVASGAVVEEEVVGEVAVDKARVALFDVDALASWKHDESIDGRADFVFWGLDAAKAAEISRAARLEDGQFGWTELAIEEAIERGTAVEQLRAERSFRFVTDFRPHSHHFQVMAQVRGSATESGTLEVGGARMCAFMTSWGDGIFPIERLLARDGGLLGIRLVLAGD